MDTKDWPAHFASMTDAAVREAAAAGMAPSDPIARAALSEELKRRATRIKNMTSAEVIPQQVIVTDIRMPFGSMVTFMTKWALASIPALLILAILGALLAGVIAGMFGGLARR